jgi:hypothetical protein
MNIIMLSLARHGPDTASLFMKVLIKVLRLVTMDVRSKDILSLLLKSHQIILVFFYDVDYTNRLVDKKGYFP